MIQDPSSLAEAATAGNNITISQLLEVVDRIPEPAFYMALTAWLLLYVIGWFGGIKDHKKVFVITVVASTLIAIGSLPVPASVLKFLLGYFNTSVIPVFAVLICYLAFIIAMAVSLYETWVVTQEEITSDKG